MRLGQTYVARAPHLVGAHALGNRPLDPGAYGVLGGEGWCALTFTRGEERLVFRAWMQGELAWLRRAARALRPRGAGPTGGGAKLDADDGRAVLLPRRQPLGARAPGRAGQVTRSASQSTANCAAAKASRAC